MYETKQNPRTIERDIYAYLFSIPYFYIKFLKIIFDKLGIDINYSSYENPLLKTPNLALQNLL